MSGKETEFEIEPDTEQVGKRRKIDHDNPFPIENSSVDNDQQSLCGSDLKADIELVQPEVQPSISEDVDTAIIRCASESDEIICGSGDCSLAIVDNDQQSLCGTDLRADIELVQREAQPSISEDVDTGIIRCAFESDEVICGSGDCSLAIVDTSCNTTETNVDSKSEVVENDVIAQSSMGIDITSSRRKLLVLDVNGLLADVVSVSILPDDYKADMISGMKAVFKRPYCDDFLQFCFERFNVGIWSSRTKRNVDSVLELLLGEKKSKLVFCWDQSHCTLTGFMTLENRKKPLVLKELKKLWEKHEPSLPWNIGDYNESNTLLLDDSPYKSLKNPPNTSIFPDTYDYKNSKDDSLGPEGDLRSYLERLSLADNIQKYVEDNPYGQQPITESNPSWSFYANILGLNSVRRDESSCHSDVTHASRENITDIEWSKKTVKEESVSKDIHSTENIETKDLLSNKDQPQDCSVTTGEPSRLPWIPHSSLGRNREVFCKTKLLILDVNGLLADFVSCVPDGYTADSILGDYAVFKRPYCDDFLNFCFEKFHIGFWLTTSRKLAQSNLEFLLGRAAKDVLFSWDISNCIATGFRSVDRDRQIILKELKRLWERDERYLSCGRGKFDQSNTLLVDNYPSTALLNPPHTAIFPPRYRYKDEKTDNSLGPEGSLRVYLEGLALAENVQDYVKNKPFGQRPISDKNLSWKYYVTVIEETEAHQKQLLEKVWTHDHKNEQNEQHSSWDKRDKPTGDRNSALTACSSIEPSESSGNIREENAISDIHGHDPPTQPSEQNRQPRASFLVHLSSNKDQRQDGCDKPPHLPWNPRSSLGRNREVFRKTKLLILDVNGLLADFVSCEPEGYRADSKLGDKAVFKRPYCDDFLNFCFEKFHIGFWLTTSRKNAQANLNFLLGRAAKDLLFSWDISHCYETSFNTLERRNRHILFKELRVVWEKDEWYSPWGREVFDQSNTLLVDNYHTLLCLILYRFKNETTDDSLGPGGDLRVFLEGLVLAENVQDYVKNNPFGEAPISDEHPSWNYYVRVIEESRARQKPWLEWSPTNDHKRTC